MIEKLDMGALYREPDRMMQDKINELVDFANSRVNEPMGATGVGYNPINPAEPTESKTSSAEKVLKYCRQKGVMCENSSNLGFCSLTACNKEQYNMQSIIEPTEKMYTINEVAEMLYHYDKRYGECGIWDMPKHTEGFCKQHSCGGLCKDPIECWKHAIESGWLKGE